VRLIFKGIGCLIMYIFANTIGRIFYSNKYMKGRWFKTWHSLGWKWIWIDFWGQKICGKNRNIPWPVSPQMIVANAKNIEFDVDDLNDFQNMGCYFQCYKGKISIGKGTYIAPNCGLITENHDVKNLDNHMPPKDILIGERCWIGMNTVILPGVVLGNNTVVGAGSIVTKSFAEGNCVIAGNPAQIIRKID